MISARPPKAPTGKPPPMILPKQLRSALMPNRSCAPPHARRANGGHARFRAGVAHADFLHTRHCGADEFRHRHLERIWNAKTRAVFSSLLDCSDDFRVRMAKDCRSPGAHIVKVFVAIDVPHARAFGFLNEERLPAHGSKRR